MKTLVVIDIEKEWITKTSEYYLGNISSFMKKLNLLIEYCRRKGHKIIFVRHVELAGKAFRKGKGAEFIDNLSITSKDVVIEKNKISAFYRTNIEKMLSKDVIIAGILTNLCVRSFVNDAYDREYALTLVEDCCVSVSKKMHQYTLEDFQLTRPEVKIASLQNFLKL